MTKTCFKIVSPTAFAKLLRGPGPYSNEGRVMLVCAIRDGSHAQAQVTAV